MLSPVLLSHHIVLQTAERPEQFAYNDFDLIDIKTRIRKIIFYGNMFAGKSYALEYPQDKLEEFEAVSEDIQREFAQNQRTRTWKVLNAEACTRIIGINTKLIKMLVFKKIFNNFKVLLKSASIWISFDERTFNRVDLTKIFKELCRDYRKNENSHNVYLFNIQNEDQDVFFSSRFCTSVESHEGSRSLIFNSPIFLDGHLTAKMGLNMTLKTFRTLTEPLRKLTGWQVVRIADPQKRNRVLHYLNNPNASDLHQLNLKETLSVVLSGLDAQKRELPTPQRISA